MENCNTLQSCKLILDKLSQLQRISVKDKRNNIRGILKWNYSLFKWPKKLCMISTICSFASNLLKINSSIQDRKKNTYTSSMTYGFRLLITFEFSSDSTRHPWGLVTFLALTLDFFFWNWPLSRILNIENNIRSNSLIILTDWNFKLPIYASQVIICNE